METSTPIPIYLDHHATTPVDPRVAAVVLHVMTSAYGNANSVEHYYGEAAAALVADARCEVAKLVNADPNGVHFTSGSSESIRLALAHAVNNRQQKALRVAVTTVEHSAVLKALANYEQAGEVILRWLPVDHHARLNMESLETACDEGVDLICVMAANNEVGTLYPIEKIARIAIQVGAQTLVDATQAVGQFHIDFTAWGITYLAISGHKIYGPKGIGALVTLPEFEVRVSSGPTPGVGDGTPNVPGIVGLGEACKLRCNEMAEDGLRITAQRDRLESLLRDGIDGLVINGDRENRLSNNLHISVLGIPNDAIVTRLRRQVAISTGAACMSGAQSPSHVLQAMGLSSLLQEGALRIGIGKFTKDEEIESAAEFIVQTVNSLKLALG